MIKDCTLVFRNPTPCQGVAGILFGHQYEATFDSELPAMKWGPVDTTASGFARVMDSLRSHYYKGHVCRRCGHVVNKGQ